MMMLSQEAVLVLKLNLGCHAGRKSLAHQEKSAETQSCSGQGNDRPNRSSNKEWGPFHGMDVRAFVELASAH